MQDLALAHQILDGASHVLNRHLRIDPVLVEQIAPVRAKALEHAFDGQLDMVRTADETRASLASLKIDVPTELAGDHDLVPERRNGFAENPLTLMRAVGLGGVEKGDAAFIGRADDIEDVYKRQGSKRGRSSSRVISRHSD